MIFIINPDSIKKKEIAKTLSSLANQTYKNWYVILIYNSSEYGVSNEIKKLDKRLLLYNISRESNKTISLIGDKINTKDEYINIIQQGSTLVDENVLMTIQKSLKETEIDIIYTDENYTYPNSENKISHFKPAWNPDYLTSFNYIGHTVFIRYNLFSEWGGFRLLLIEKKIIYKLILQYKSNLHEKRIYRLPILSFQTPLQKTLEVQTNYEECTYLLPDIIPFISLIIPTKNEYKILKKCINSIFKQKKYKNFEIIIIDNKSKDQETLNYLEQLTSNERIRVFKYNKKFNYSAINNFAVSQAKGSLIGLINNDIEAINDNWLYEMVMHACRPDIGCVGAKLYYPDGTIQHGGIILGIKGTASHAHKHFPGDHPGYFNRLSVVHNVSAVTAACLVMRKELFEKVGGFDEVNLKVAYNDVDLCLKVLQLGYRNLWTPYAELIHYESKSRGKKRSWWQRRKLRKETRFLQKKWGDLLLNDPAYNPNLTLEREDFSPKETP